MAEQHASMPEAALPPTAHPLEPCSGEELERAASILIASGKLSDNAPLSCGFLVEPAKDTVENFRPGAAVERIVRLAGHDHERRQSYDARVSLSDGTLRSFDWVETGQASVWLADFFPLREVVRASPEWQQAMRRRGIEDLDLVHVEGWVTVDFPPDFPADARVMRAIFFLHDHPEDNHYARPIQNVVAYVDLGARRAIIEDHGVVPIPTAPGEYAADRVDTLRQDLRPLEITQPEGPSFEVEGHCIRWQKWQLRVSLHPLEGLALHDIRYDDDGNERRILHRAALSDMIVPYGEPGAMHSWKNALDAAEAGLGQLSNSLRLGCDCLGEIHYFDADKLLPNGKTMHAPNAICLHEEDYGVLWKHTGSSIDGKPRPEVRRSRRLVVSAFSTLGNYDYGFYWYFYLDGTIQHEIKLTGMVAASAVGDGAGSEYAPLVAPGITSPIHQHLFCYRLDFDLDGERNSVYEVDVEPVPASEVPSGTAFRSVSRVLRTEREAQRNIDPARGRSWRVVNPNVHNGLGAPVGYKLLPHATPTILAADDSVHGQRGAFARHNLWVTPYSPDEMDAGAGPFSYHHPGGAGLPAFTAADRPIENTDIVLWHSFGVTHTPRPEDWPVMPVEYAGFTLLPVGFFDRNPAIDVPPNHGHQS